MTHMPACIPLILIALVSLCCRAAVAEVTVEPSQGGAVVKVDGQPFTEYLTKSGTKPILWPVLGPAGIPVTRAFPMGKAPDEDTDHVHQRSFWFTHGEVNGVNFWMEGEKAGRIVHREFVRRASGPVGAIVTRNDWVAPDGKKVLEDQRDLQFGHDGEIRWINFNITLKATEGPVKFGDTKEGAFGLRVAGTMQLKQPKGKQGGRIVNSDGLVDKAAWGKRAAWVDYVGPVDADPDGRLTVGIAILNHPSSFRFPTYWHVRDYGLFAANPFGVKDFTGNKDADGSYTLPAGESLMLRYRVLLHRGDERQGRIAEAYAKYAAESP